MNECHFSRSSDRRTVFLEVARRHFLERGYAGTSLAEIVADSGGSLATLYKMFTNKDGLFRAVLADFSHSGAAIVEHAAATHKNFETALYSVGETLHRMFLEPERMTMHRVVIERSVNDPDFGRRFHEETVIRTHNAFEAFLTGWERRGVKLNGSAAELTAIFLSLIVYDFQIEAISHMPALETRKATMRDRIAFFIRGAGADSGAS